MYLHWMKVYNIFSYYIIGYCTCMGICVERVLLAELPELALPKELVQHNIFPYKCNNL